MPKLTDVDMVEGNTGKRKSKSKKRTASTRSPNKEEHDAKRINQNVSIKAGESENKPPPDSALLDEAMIEIATKVGDCVTAQNENAAALNVQSDRLTDSDKEIESLKRDNKRLTKRLDNMDAALKSTLERVGNVERTANTNLHLLKNNNIVVEGVPEIQGENCMNKVCLIFQAIESKCHMDDIISAYRVGQKPEDGKYARPIVAKMMDPLVKTVIMEGKGKLMKDELYSKVFLNDDLPPQMKKERKVLREICKYAYSVGYKGCKVSGSKLVIEGKAYRYDTIHLLPQDLQLCNLRTRMVGDGIGFQGEESFLSNFHPATLTMEQLTFSSAEQAYQYFKCRTCKRDDKANKILTMSNPRDIKMTGDDTPSRVTWEQSKESFMRSIIYCKFNQNDELKMKLLNTGDLPLYECTRNRWWGSGLRLDSPEWDSSVCPGLNKLGNIIADVRKVLRKQTFPCDAALKSPSALIKSVTKMDREIQLQVGTLAEEAEQPQQAVPRKATLEEDLKGESDMDVQDDVSSVADSDDLMGETEIDEESVNISTSSAISHVSNKSGKTSVLDVTGADGKLDLSKIRKWTIPSLGQQGQSSTTGRIHTRTRSQMLRNTLPATSSTTPKLLNPQAQSTPVSGKLNRSLTLQKVREKLGTSTVKE